MIRTFYISIEEDSKKIRDICDVPSSGYIEVQLNTPLPPMISSGCYKWENDSAIYVEAWDIQAKDLEDKISILEAEQSVQNDEILTSMLATSEVFEMVLTMASTPVTMSVDDNTKNNKNIGGNSMVEVYATLILKGVKTIEDVPVIIRAQVAERLRQLEVPVK